MSFLSVYVEYHSVHAHKSEISLDMESFFNFGSSKQRWALDWVRAMTRFVEFGLDPDCK